MVASFELIILTVVQAVSVIALGCLLVLMACANSALLTASGTCKVLCGVILGAVSVCLGVMPLMEMNDVHVTAAAGPLLAAGAFFGPVAAAVAGGLAIGWALASETGGAVVNAVHAAIGAGLFLLLTQRGALRMTWPATLGLAATGAVASAVFAIVSAEPPAMPSFVPYVMAATALSGLLMARAIQMGLDWIEADREHRSYAERLALATHAGGIGVWEYDLLTDTPKWDARMHEIYETSPDSFDGVFDEWINRIHPDDREDLQAGLQSVLTDGISPGSEFRVRMPDGSYKHIKAEAAVVTDRAGRPLRLVGSNVDITELRRVEERAADSSLRFAAAGQNIPGGLFRYTLRANGSDAIHFLNSGCVDIWELGPEELGGDPAAIWNMVHPEDAPMLRASVAKSATRLGKWECVWRVTTPSGRLKWLHGHGIPHRTAEGDTIWDSLILDITDLKRTEEELRKSQKLLFQAQKMDAIGKLTGGIAHDFNNLLAVIVGNQELLRAELRTPLHLEFVDASLKAAMTGADLVKKMLSFSRQARLAPTRINVNKRLGAMEDWIRRLFPESIRIEHRLDPVAGAIEVDVASFEAALLNLFLNSRDAMPDGGTLTVATSRIVHEGNAKDDPLEDLAPGSYCLVTVTDTGSGISPDVLPHIFEPFFTTKGPGAGSGLGIPMVDGFLRQSGGGMLVRSDRGQGTQVSLYFPADEKGEGDVQAAKASATPWISMPLDILLVEDESEVARVTGRILQNAGYTVRIASSGEEAVEIFRDAGPFDLLISDVVMPGPLQGDQVAQVLRAGRPDLPVVFISGYPRDLATRGEGMRESDIMLMKPILAAELARAIEQTLQAQQGGEPAAPGVASTGAGDLGESPARR